jgi:hypothetical protein
MMFKTATILTVVLASALTLVSAAPAVAEKVRQTYRLIVSQHINTTPSFRALSLPNELRHPQTFSSMAGEESLLKRFDKLR